MYIIVCIELYIYTLYIIYEKRQQKPCSPSPTWEYAHSIKSIARFSRERSWLGAKCRSRAFYTYIMRRLWRGRNVRQCKPKSRPITNQKPLRMSERNSGTSFHVAICRPCPRLFASAFFWSKKFAPTPLFPLSRRKLPALKSLVGQPQKFLFRITRGCSVHACNEHTSATYKHLFSSVQYLWAFILLHSAKAQVADNGFWDVRLSSSRQADHGKNHLRYVVKGYAVNIQER